MASINGVSGSNTTSSLYNSSKVISGLASGLDTESMIEGLVQGYQTKIQSLQNKATKIGWKQDAYRSIISKMNTFANKYTSYTSSTNLMSAAFFNSAIKVASQGNYSSKVSASGRTDSDISVTSVQQLASAASISTVGNLQANTNFTVTGDSVSLTDDYSEGALSGSLSIAYGGKTVSVVFDPSKDIIQDKNEDGTERSAADKAADLAQIINKKLADTKITLSSGEARSASELMSVTANADGRIVFADKTTAGNGVYISGSSGTVGETLGLDLGDKPSESKVAVIDMNKAQNLIKEQNRAEYISGKGMNISLDGKSKSITLPTIEKSGEGAGAKLVFKDKDGNTIKDADGNDLAVNGKNYADLVQKAVDEKFGKNKIEVGVNGGADESDPFSLSFKTAANSSLIINSDAGKALGIGNIATNYLNTSNTLESLLGKGFEDSLTAVKNDDGSDKLDSAGNKLYAFEINGVKIGEYTKDTKLSTIMSDINSNSDAGVKVAYSQTSQKFTFTAKETGDQGKVNIEGGGLAAAIFGEINETTANYNAGKNAIFTVKVNGEELRMERDSNSATIDGMTLNFKGTFNTDHNIGDALDIDNAVSFETSSDADKIVEVVRSMVNDYNEMMTEIRGQYATMPYQNSSGAFQSYEPLTDDDRATMSESAIKAYEDKAKQGILFGDRDLSALYEQMSAVFSPGGTAEADLQRMGIELSYSSDNVATVTLDENKLREALADDPDAVADMFTRNSSSGGSDGIMQSMKTQLDRYAGLTGSYKGILVEQAGTPLNSLSLMNNAWQQQIDNYNEEITKWQEKLSSQVDKYTSMFSKLEVLINQMNSQSSTLAGLMGG